MFDISDFASSYPELKENKIPNSSDWDGWIRNHDCMRVGGVVDVEMTNIDGERESLGTYVPVIHEDGSHGFLTFSWREDEEGKVVFLSSAELEHWKNSLTSIDEKDMLELPKIIYWANKNLDCPVTVEDSLRGGNCRPGTAYFLRFLRRKGFHGGQAITLRQVAEVYGENGSYGPMNLAKLLLGVWLNNS